MSNRSEMNPAFQWDLSAIYKDQTEWEQALASAAEAVSRLDSLPGTLGTSIESLKQALDQIDAAEAQVEKVYCYASLSKAGDNGDARAQEMEARAISLFVSLETACAFLQPELLAIDAEKLDAWIADEKLAKYRHSLSDIVRGRAHTLDAQSERLLAMLGDAAQTPSNTFDMFESVDMRFPDIPDETGKMIPLTHGSFAAFRECRNRDVRKNAFETYFGEFEKYIHMLTACYSGSVKLDSFFADARHHESACHAALFENNVPIALYDSLTEAVHAALPTMRDYLELRKSLLGYETLNLYDLYVPMMDDVTIEMPYEKAQALVKEALKPLGEGYQKLLDRAFSERWIDVYENAGKTTGAFSEGVFGAHPYVLLNYAGTLDDAFTLAHELGHAMHSWFSDTTQPYATHNYSIFVAEVASTVNEVLLTKYLLAQETDHRRKAAILNHFLEGFRTTVFRQTLFAEFERKAHDMYKSGTPLTAEALNKVYHDLNALYYEGCEINAYADIEWARIPHFYRAFYVYQYATGFCSAVAIADHIVTSGDASDYLKFLTTGGSDYPLNELAIAGVDLTRPDTVANAMRVFRETLEELKALIL